MIEVGCHTPAIGRSAALGGWVVVVLDTEPSMRMDARIAAATRPSIPSPISTGTPCVSFPAKGAAGSAAFP
ncbi:MAG: hypothetical protein M3Q30_14755 [Actinomycetota bacterium]|nr:hypothetical protein [Actinomycetota bacterium]